MSEQTCAAEQHGCGTEKGYRNGGRCWRCRAVHSAAQRKTRGLTDGQREALLQALRDGTPLAEAVERAGISEERARRTAQHDPELRAAVLGYPQVVQDLNRRGEYLSALIAARGDRTLAAKISGETPDEIDEWLTDAPFRKAVEQTEQWVQSVLQRGRATAVVSDELPKLWADPELRAIDIADHLGITTMTLRAWARTAGLPPASKRHTQQKPRKFTAEHAARAAEMLANGASLRAAAAAVGVTPQTVRRQADAHPTLKAALPPDTRVVLTPEVEREFRRLWGDPELSAKEVAQQVGVKKYGTLKEWADRLGLPSARERPGRRPPLTDRDLSRAAQLLREGATQSAAAEAVGVSHAALRWHAERHEELREAMPAKGRPPRRPSNEQDHS